jgi:hypothetical protein
MGIGAAAVRFTRISWLVSTEVVLEGRQASRRSEGAPLFKKAKVFFLKARRSMLLGLVFDLGDIGLSAIPIFVPPKFPKKRLIIADIIDMVVVNPSLPVREEIRLFLGTLAVLSGSLSLAFAFSAYNQAFEPHFMLSCAGSVALAATSVSLFIVFWKNSTRTRMTEHAKIANGFQRR